MRYFVLIVICCLSGILSLGCGQRRKLQPPAPAKSAQESVSAVEFGGLVIRVSAADGRWRFEASSPHVKSEGINGPYTLTPAEGNYQEKDKKPVLMRADRARVEKLAERVILQGSVTITSDGWLLEAKHVDYDLKTGKVKAPGWTKLTFGGKSGNNKGWVSQHEDTKNTKGH